MVESAVFAYGYKEKFLKSLDFGGGSMKANGGQMEGDFTYDPVGLGSQDRKRMIKEKLPMKMIQTLSDIDYLKATNKIPIELIKEVEQDFLNLYEAENNDLYLLEFRLSPWHALFVFEKGDDVLSKINDPFALEYVEKVKSEHYKSCL